MSKHRVLSLKPQLRLEWRSQDGQNETEQPDHSASLGDSITASTQIRFSVHTSIPSGASRTCPMVLTPPALSAFLIQIGRLRRSVVRKLRRRIEEHDLFPLRLLRRLPRQPLGLQAFADCWKMPSARSRAQSSLSRHRLGEMPYGLLARLRSSA